MAPELEGLELFDLRLDSGVPEKTGAILLGPGLQVLGAAEGLRVIDEGRLAGEVSLLEFQKTKLEVTPVAW